MTQLNIIKSTEVKSQNIRGETPLAGQVKRIVSTEKFFFNVDEISPGFSPHRWHQHTKYTHDGQLVEYGPEFEEIYYVVSGRGVIQWKDEAGTMSEQPVGPGDAIHMPPGVVEHQLLNNGTEKLQIVVVGVPPPTRTRIA